MSGSTRWAATVLDRLRRRATSWRLDSVNSAGRLREPAAPARPAFPGVGRPRRCRAPGWRNRQAPIRVNQISAEELKVSPSLSCSLRAGSVVSALAFCFVPFEGGHRERQFVEQINEVAVSRKTHVTRPPPGTDCPTPCRVMAGLDESTL